MKYETTAGVDEAGRGALAGPVVAGAVCLPVGVSVPVFIQDSKTLSPKKRDEAYVWITTHCAFGLGIVPSTGVDALGIKKANHLAMQRAVASLQKRLRMSHGSDPLQQLLVDGNDNYTFALPSTSIIRGDATHPCISAGGIMAKVTRDRIMLRWAELCPQFGFGAHKGYGEASHLQQLREGTHSIIHRKSYDPLRTVLTQYSLF